MANAASLGLAMALALHRSQGRALPTGSGRPATIKPLASRDGVGLSPCDKVGLPGGRQMPRRISAILLGLSAAIFMLGAPSASFAAGPPTKMAETGEFRAMPMPYVFGRHRDAAASQLQAAGFTPRFVGATGPDATVIAQSIDAGQARPRGAVVVLRMGMVEGGGTTAPRLLGLNRDAASGRAEASGLKPLFYGPNEPGVLVASQSVPAGQQVARGTYIQLQMRAPTTILRMPNFSGLAMEEARALASANRLRATFSGDDGQGARIVSQTPTPGSETSAGADVELRLGISQIRVPRFTGRSRAVASAIAAKTGLVLDISGDGGDSARVSQQSPGAGRSVPPESHVAIVMAPAQAVSLIVPQVTGLTSAAAAAALAQSNLRMEGAGSPSATAVVMSQIPLAGANAAPQDVVRVVLGARDPASVALPHVANDSRGSTVTIAPKKTGSPGWLAPLGGLGVGAAAVVAWLVFRRPKPGDIVPPDTTPSEPRHDPDPKPVAPVVYNAVVDAGRPTVRFAHEPPVAARALTLPRATEGTRS